ncbi:Membrane-bound lytic murein transglycosylase D [Hydrogenovibrio crunogenus]|uniref:Membrane-bound lytic murein transglycosylase D n=1 Tax=Hydrogenovibrio crunogenus TaxID=39765 RepID=A0A4P7NYW7_9GAMM|nr:LysM peptidoglycan-binding domain-containing protein [Hydrogenovibrio crunogenus]QBZ82947.1 Membrane-bound lytic murein transglycosylase D [Hydrogenovibrio crunogenus]
MTKHTLFSSVFTLTMMGVLLSGCSQFPFHNKNHAYTNADDINFSKLPVTDPVTTDTEETDAFEKTIQNSTKRFLALKTSDDLSNQLDQALILLNDKPTYDDLWQELSEHLFLAPANSEHFEDYQNYYENKKAYLKRVSVRAKPYLYFILNEVNRRHMPYEIALLPVVESGYYPYAKSYVNASGLWQFMPATGYMFGLHRNWWYDGRQDVYKSTLAALDYLQALYKQNDYDWLLALASYNGGYGNVLKAQKRYLRKHPNGEPSFWNIRTYLPKETQHYVPQLLAISNLIIHREDYDIDLEPVPNTPFFKRVEISNQISLPKVAQSTQTSQAILKVLNPGYLRLATPPSGSHSVLLPIEVADAFKVDYQQKPHFYEVNWMRHKIRSGESLSVIAAKYNTSSREIKKLNNMKNSFLRAGKTLLIPLPQSQQLAQTPLKRSTSYNGKKHIHKVQAGESLWTIARYYNTSPRKLCEWNRISIREPIRKGQKLVIRSDRYGRKVSHTLKEGESLWVVAKKYRVTTQELCNWNGIKKSAVLHPGVKIKVWIKS